MRRGRQRLDGEAGASSTATSSPRGRGHARTGELEEAIVHANSALELALQLRSADFRPEAQQALGRVLIDRGNARDGLEQLDEAMLLAVEGRLSPYSTGKVYCSLISVRAGRRLPTCG